jgi:two-component system chemotaxis sensor kinase CheA
MEELLLSLSEGDVDSESVNTIFRAAHSIKGGSGTFGFTAVSDFTHVMETLLDEMRDGRRQVTQPAVDVLLGSVDCLKEMLMAIQDEQEVDDASVAEYKKALEIELNGAESKEQAQQQEPEESSLELDIKEQAGEGWRIAFSPHANLLQTGNDPVRMFRELASLGELTATVDFQGVPDFFDLDPEECHLSWNLEVAGDIPISEVNDIFDWVEDECDLAIQPIAEQSQNDGENAPVEESSIKEQPSETKAEAKTEKAVKPAKPATSKKPTAKGSSSIRVDTSKIDTLINMVGELVITQSMLSLVGENFELNKLDQLKNGLSQLERHTRELQESVMNIRMLPISFVFSRFPRLVHDLSTKLDKKIEFVIVGEHT